MWRFAVRPRFVKRLVCLALALLLILAIGGRLAVEAVEPSQAENLEWAAPAHKALRRVGGLPTTQNHPNFLSNLDCTPVTYRLVSEQTMRTGCFTPTAFGMLDSSNDNVIFNNTDEGLPLLPYSPHQVLVPWPQAGNLVTIDAASLGGAYIGLYKNAFGLMRDERNYLGQLTGKRMGGPPEIIFRDAAGQLIRVNAQTIAFSAGGSWLAVETLHSSFIRINLATLEMTAFAPAFGNSSSPALLSSQVAVSDNGRFVAIQNNAAHSFKIYDLERCSGPAIALQPRNCPSYDYWPYANQQIGGLQSIRRTRFIGSDLLSFEAVASNTTVSGVYELAPAESISSMSDYLGLGDSYTSGEGAFDYLAGTDTGDNTCHLAAKSYPLLLVRDLFSPTGGHSVACSGAVINDIDSTSDSYRGQVKNGESFRELSQEPGRLETVEAGFQAGYIAQHRFVQRYRPRVVTVSIGGNDIGFGDMLQNCVMPRVSRHSSDETCYNTYESRKEVVQLVDRTVPRWVALYKQLRAENSDGQLYAIGYPSVASDLGRCGRNVHLSKSELEFAEELIAYLNGAIKQAAAAAAVPYVDISRALEGHRLCEADGAAAAVNGLTAGNDSGPFGISVLGRESYHPNALGHELIERAILQQTENLKSSVPPNAGSNDSQTLLNAPRTGRVIRALLPARDVVPPVIQTGAGAEFKIAGLEYGLKPNAVYAVRLDYSDAPAVATISSDASSNIATTITFPATDMPGGHSLHITGNNQADQPIDITQPIYLTSNIADADGDGAENSSDSCPYAINSGQDTDRDGVDDACDNIIALPAGNEGAGPGPGSPSQPTDQSGHDSGNTVKLLDNQIHIQAVSAAQPQATPSLMFASHLYAAHGAAPMKQHVGLIDLVIGPAVLCALLSGLGIRQYLFNKSDYE